LYAITLLVVSYRVQLNIMGRNMPQFSVNNKDESNLSSETQLEYLSFIQQYLLQNGLNQLAVIVEEAVSENIDAYDLRSEITYEDIKTIFNKIRNNIEKKPSNKDRTSELLNVILPVETPSNGSYNPQLQILLDETRDVIESEDFDVVLKESLRNVFNMLLEQCKQFFDISTDLNEIPMNINTLNYLEIRKPLPKFIPFLNNLCESKQENAVFHCANKHNLYINILSPLSIIQEFCAVVNM